MLAIPALESFLAHNSFSAEVKGIKDIQREMEARFGPGYHVPPVALTFWSFRIMVAAGFWMLFLVLYAYYLERKGKLESSPGVLKALLYTIPVPYIANTCGWIMAEVERQPWIVYGLQRIEEALSPCVTSGQLLITLVGFTLVLGILAGVDAWLLARFAREVPVTAPKGEGGASLWY